MTPALAVTSGFVARQTGMRTDTTTPPIDLPRGGSSRWAILWITLITLFLALSLVWPVRADRLTASASRTLSFGPVAGVRSVEIDNVSGDVELTAGAAFSATVELKVSAVDQKKADEQLAGTEVAFENAGGALSLTTVLPGSSRDGSRGHRWSRGAWDSVRVEARYRVIVPKDAAVEVSLVNGAVRSQGVEGALTLGTVNGTVDVKGARGDLSLQSVNGLVDASLASLPKGTHVECETVNGSVVLRLPKDASFHLSARTLSGDVLSTFPLPARVEDVAADEARAGAEVRRAAAAAERDRLRAERDRAKAEKRSEGDFEKEMEQFGREMERFGREMEAVSREMEAVNREIARSVRVDIDRSYEGTVGAGGSSVKANTVNGKVWVLAEGTAQADARTLVGSRRSKGGHAYHVAPVPPVSPVPPVPPVPGAPPLPPAPPANGHSYVRGDVDGDVVTTLGIGDIRLGNVSGRVKVKTQSGQVRVASAGKGALLSTSGGSIRVERVKGGLEATSLGGDVTVGEVEGDVRVQTMGGDIRLRSARGNVVVKTAGGDIDLRRVDGGVKAETMGGSIDCEVVGREIGTGVELVSAGGDVTVSLPAGLKADVEVQVSGAEPDEDVIVSDWKELAILKKPGRYHSTVRAEGKLNGGGPKVILRTSSGTVTVRRGPAS